MNHLWVSSLNPFAVAMHTTAARNTVNPRDQPRVREAVSGVTSSVMHVDPPHRPNLPEKNLFDFHLGTTIRGDPHKEIDKPTMRT